MTQTQREQDPLNKARRLPMLVITAPADWGPARVEAFGKLMESHSWSWSARVDLCEFLGLTYKWVQREM